MSFLKKALCGVALVVVLAVVGLAIWQRDNIGALITGLRYSQTELEDQLQQNDQTIKDAMQVVPEVSIRDMTEEDKQALKDGTMTREELAQSLVQPAQKPDSKPEDPPEEQPEKTDTPAQQPEEPPAQQPEEDPVQQQIAAVIAEAYVLREEFLAKLDDLLAQAMAEYKAIPAQERAAKVPGMVSRYLSTGVSLEAQCDEQIISLVERLELLLEENGGDTSIAQTLYDTYANEKSLKKAWYMAELKKRGLV